MSSTPKRWVIKPLSPKLEQSDLRSILSPVTLPHSGERVWGSSQESFTFSSTEETMVSSVSGKSTPEAHVQAKLITVSEDGSTSEEWTPSAPSSPASTTGSHSGFYSFVDDPTSPEAELNEVYMVSSKRQAKLNTLKEKNSFKVQTYSDGKRPGRLFEDEDDPYKIENSSTPYLEEEENPNRLEIIRNQAPKKSSSLKKQWSALENLDFTRSPHSQRLVDGFSLQYKPVRDRSELVKLEPGSIDNEQIDFNTARKQFLEMEQSKQNTFLLSPQHSLYSPKIRGQTFSSNASIFSPKQSQTNHQEDTQTFLATQQKAEVTSPSKDPEDAGLGSVLNEVDSGFGEYGGANTIDGSDPFNSVHSLTEETPIEREIRFCREREENLRRSRGIFCSDNSEMVEIRTKPILSSPQVKPTKMKETNRVSFLVQRELALDRHQQTPGEGKTFESQPIEIQVKSQGGRPDEDLDQRDISLDDTWGKQQNEFREDCLSPCCPHRHPEEPRTYKYIGSNRTLKKESSWISEKPQKSRVYSPTILSKLDLEVNGVHTPPWKPQLENTKQSPKMQKAVDSIRQEIEEDLKREQELQEMRECLLVPTSTCTSAAISSEPRSPLRIEKNGPLTPLKTITEAYSSPLEMKTDFTYTYSSQVFLEDKSPQLSSPLLHSRLPSMSVMTPQPWNSIKNTSLSVSQASAVTSLGAPVDMSSPSLQKGLADTLVKDFEERRNKLKLEESAYAGIQPIDSINNEVVEATRVTKHKNQRALKWEAGLYANQER